MWVFDGLAAIAALAAIGMLVRICWTDFFFLKIWNRDLLVLAALTLAYVGFARPGDIPLRIGLGVLFFVIPLGFWLAGKMGAGDVKLMGIAGVLIRPDQALLFCLLTLLVVLAIYLFYKKSWMLQFVPQLAGRRILELVETNRIPYGVAISLSAAVLVLSSLVGRA